LINYIIVFVISNKAELSSYT